MDVSVIMINYCTRALTEDAINSLFEYTKGLSYEIILVDNASPDGSGSELKNEYGGKIKFLQLSENLGTTKAFNRAYGLSSGKYVLWLNTDIYIKENFIKTLYDYMESNASCGICGGNLLTFDGKPNHSFMLLYPDAAYVKKLLNPLRRRLYLSRRKKKTIEYNFSGKPMEVAYITGCDMMTRRSVIERCGGLDEDFFMYYEDVEFAFRVNKLTGLKSVSVPSAKMYHLGSASVKNSAELNERGYRVTTSSMIKYLDKCFGEEEVKKFIAVSKRAYKKIAFIYKITFSKTKRDNYLGKLAVLSQLEEEYLSKK